MNMVASRPGSVTVFQNHRVSSIKNLRPGLPERGKIKIGQKGEARAGKSGREFQLPQKLDHFLITSMTRGTDGNFLRDEELHRKLGDKPTEINIQLLYNEPSLNFRTAYVAYDGKTVWCTGDGEVAQRLQSPDKTAQVKCTCEHLERSYKGATKCKISGVLQVVITDAGVLGGVWKLRTTSFNTCQGIMSSLAFISGMTGGILAGIPLVLKLLPKTATTDDGKQTTIYVVGLEFRGTADDLREVALKRLSSDASYNERMRRLEDDAVKMLEAPKVGAQDLETVEEFYPEAAARAHGVRIAQPVRVREPVSEAIVAADEVIEAEFDEPAHQDEPANDDAPAAVTMEAPDPAATANLSLRDAMNTITDWLERQPDSASATSEWWKFKPAFVTRGAGWAKKADEIETWLLSWDGAAAEGHGTEGAA